MQAGRPISYQATPAGPASPDGRQNTQQVTQHCGHRYVEPTRRTKPKHDTEPLCASRSGVGVGWEVAALGQKIEGVGYHLGKGEVGVFPPHDHSGVNSGHSHSAQEMGSQIFG